MKSRIAVLLSVTLAVLLLVVGVIPNVMPTSPVLAQFEEGTHYMYTVPYHCGFAYDECYYGVKYANYQTKIDIHNPSLGLTVTAHWKVTRSLPLPMKKTGWGPRNIGPNNSKALTCYDILARLGMSCAQGEYANGFVVIECMYELDIWVTYTAEYWETDGGGGLGLGLGLSIDVEGPIEPTIYQMVG